MNKTMNTQKQSLLTLPGRMLSAVGEAIGRSREYRCCF